MSSILYTISNNTEIHDYDYTKRAVHNLNTVITSKDFQDQSPETILSYLLDHMYRVSFGDYLKRYLYTNFPMRGAYQNQTLQDFSAVIRDSFAENHVPFSFEPSTRKPSATVKKWLTQFSARRSVVFLLAFGLRMSLPDAEIFLTKVLNESSFNMVDYKEVIYRHCIAGDLGYGHAAALINRYERDDLGEMPSAEEIVRFRTGTVHTDEELIKYLRFLRSQVHYEQKQALAYEAFDALFVQTVSLIERDLAFTRNASISAGITVDQSLRSELPAVSNQTVEEVLYSGIAPTRDGNLRRMGDSSLGDSFQRYRLSRQRIASIQKKTAAVDRFDLITLLFFLYSQRDLETADLQVRKQQCLQFIDEINEILTRCGMIMLYPVNPYESFILLCLLSPDPWDSFCEVWYQSYQD